MVYCGKPSPGCAECRRKKTRCDQAIPSCGQCVRANRTCSGYRNQLDLMFRNESEAIIGKVKFGRESSKARAKSSSPTTPTATTSAHPGDLSKAIAIRPNQWNEDLDRVALERGISRAPQHAINSGLLVSRISPTLSERACGYFNSHSSKWFRNYGLVDELCRGGDEHEPLFASISAVGLASYANSVHGPQLLNRARADYVKALRLTNTALRSRDAVRKDSTLFSVIILGIFEMVAGSNEHSLEAWTEHVNGASALLKLRGPKQFQTRAGQQLFLLANTNLIVSCVQRTIPVPEHIVKLRQTAGQFMDPALGPVWQASEVIIDAINFRAAVRDCFIVGPKAIIEAGLEIDRQFVDAFQNVPEAWKYRSEYTDLDDECVWNGRYDIYNDFWTAQIWNGMRICRIFIHEIICDQLLAESTAINPIFTIETSKEQNAQSTKTLLDMQADILATIPQYLPSSIHDRRASPMEGSRGYFVLWPLYTVGVMDLATQPIQTWVVGRLRAIAEQVGIRQATLLADVLEKHGHVAAWDTKPAPRLSKDEKILGWAPTSGIGKRRMSWWDVNLRKEDNVLAEEIGIN